MNKTFKWPDLMEAGFAILKVLKDGKTIHMNELKEKVVNKYFSHLPKELLTKRSNSGESKIRNLIGWAKVDLKMAKLVEQPSRGFIKITEKGLSFLKKEGHITYNELQKDKDYEAYMAEVNARKKEQEKVNTLVKNEEINEKNTPDELIQNGIDKLENQTKIELLEKLKNVDPYYFEKIILKLLNKMGYGDVIETSKSNDGGIDGIVNQDALGIDKIYIQAKRFTNGKVQETDIRNFIGAMSGDTEKGVFVTTSSFAEKAKIKAREAKHTIILIDGFKITDLMYEYNVGVQNREIYEVKELDEDFFEES